MRVELCRDITMSQDIFAAVMIPISSGEYGTSFTLCLQRRAASESITLITMCSWWGTTDTSPRPISAECLLHGLIPSPFGGQHHDTGMRTNMATENGSRS
jgi:hypothetical protein